MCGILILTTNSSDGEWLSMGQLMVTHVKLKCANNNKASTVVSMFSNAVFTFGIPDKVRSDRGGENTDVWRYMLHYNNMEPSCIITGSSTHNERIERMWCDVFRCVGQIFYSLLYYIN